jgi:4-amino-4-deoxy-L-arabinose transferase-like glycosyltransferase
MFVLVVFVHESRTDGCGCDTCCNAMVGAAVAVGRKTGIVGGPHSFLHEWILPMYHAICQTGAIVRRRPPWRWRDGNKWILVHDTIAIGGMLRREWCRARDTPTVT